jgi:hypothetical protein
MWLLGLLPEQQGQLLEQRLLTDEAAYQEMSLIEVELIDEYVSGELSENERAQFESYFLNSRERQQQVRIANALKNYVREGNVASQPVRDLATSSDVASVLVTSNPFWSTVRNSIVPVSLAACLILGTIFWIVIRYRSQPVPPAFAVTLAPGGQTREGGSLQRIVVGPDVESLELQAKLPKAGFQRYRAMLLNSEERTVLLDENVKSNSVDSNTELVVVPVPLKKAPPGEYQLKIDGLYVDGRLESAASYRFIIAHK